MPIKVSQIRTEYPGYEDLNDYQLISAYRKAKYPDVPIQDFAKVIDYDTQRKNLEQDELKDMGAVGRFTAGLGRPVQQLKNTLRRLNPMDDFSQEDAEADAKAGEPLMHTSEGFAGNLAGEGALTYLGARGLQGAANVAGKVLPGAVEAASRARSSLGALGNTAREVAREIPVAGRVLAPVVGGAVAAAPAAIGGAAQGAAFTPEDPGRGAAWGAGGGAAGQGIASGVGRVAGGAVAPSISADARQLIDQDIRVPYWKATENPAVRGTFERAKGLPLVGNIMKGQEAQAMHDYTRALQRQANPRMPVVDEAGNILRWEQPAGLRGVGQDAMAELSDKYRAGYDRIYGNRVLPLDEEFTSSLDDIARATEMHASESLPGINDALSRVQHILAEGNMEHAPTTSPILQASGQAFEHPGIPGREGVSGVKIKQALADIDQRIKDNYGPSGNPMTARILAQVRDELEGVRLRGLPPEVQAELGDFNRSYANFKLLEEASKAKGAIREGGVVTPQQQLDAVIRRDQKLTGKANVTRGRAHGQEEAQRAQRVLGSELPDVGPGTAEKGSLLAMLIAGGWLAPTTTAVTAFATSPTGQHFIEGGYPWQVATRNGTNNLASLLRLAPQLGTVLGEAQTAQHKP